MDPFYFNSSPRARKPDPVAALVYSLLVAVGGYVVVCGFFEFQRTAEKSKAEARTLEQANANAKARDARRRDGYLAIDRRKLEHEQELESVFGDRLLAIVRNPRLSIAQEIEALGRSLAPSGSTIRVTIDRFTEFDVTVQLPVEKSPAEMAAICARLLEYDAKYLHRIRFYAANRLIGELDPSAISNAIASSTTDGAVLAGALEKSVLDVPAPAPASDQSASSQGMSDEDDALRTVIGNWNASVDSHLRGIDEIIAGLCDCVDLTTLKAKGDLSERLKKVEAFTEPIANEKAYFARAVDTLRETLAGNDPLVISIIMRQVQQREKGLLRQTKPLLLDLAALQSRSRELLKELDEHSKDWSLVDGSHIKFSTASPLINYKVRSAAVAEIAQRVNERLRAMNATVPSTPP